MSGTIEAPGYYTGTLPLSFAWGLRLKLRAEGGRLHAEGRKLRIEGNRLYAEGGKLWAEGSKFRVEGNKFYAEGGKLPEIMLASLRMARCLSLERLSGFHCQLKQAVSTA